MTSKKDHAKYEQILSCCSCRFKYIVILNGLFAEILSAQATARFPANEKKETERLEDVLLKNH